MKMLYHDFEKTFDPKGLPLTRGPTFKPDFRTTDPENIRLTGTHITKIIILPKISCAKSKFYRN